MGAVYPPSGVVASISTTFIDEGVSFCRKVYGGIENLPPSQINTYYIVSERVMLDGLKAGRYDLVTPAVGHPDCVINEDGEIISVPCFWLEY